MEGAKIRAENFRTAQRRVEIHPHDRLAAAPLLDPAIAPDDRVVGIDQHDAVGHALQNPLVLQQLADAEGFGEMLAVNKNARVTFAGQSRERPHRAADFFDFDVVADIGCQIYGWQVTPVVGIAKKQDFALGRQSNRLPSAGMIRAVDSIIG